MASFAVPCPKCSSFTPLEPAHQNQHSQPRKVSFGVPFNSRFSLISRSSFGDQQPDRKQSSVWKVQAQLNEVAVEKSSNSAPVFEPKSGPTSSNLKEESTEKTVPDASSISEFMTQVADLVKLVDSRDITELHLKNLDLEVTIRKKEALLPPPSVAPYVTIQHPVQHAMVPAHQPPPPAIAPPPASPASALAPPALPAPPKASTSSHPPLKCPMAGTFYRSPGPGEPPFVKVGDKVQKGQVICIIEAMKLMNDIEADQSGTVVEILMEDGKPVSIDTPLFVIAP